MKLPRSAGVLLHPSSLSGGQGIGDLGQEAYRFVEWLARHDQQVWQVLPLGPTGFGDSPYQCFSAIAGNHMLLSLEPFVERGWLESVPTAPPEGPVDFGRLFVDKTLLLSRAYEGFQGMATAAWRERFEAFCQSPRNDEWLTDYARFRALKDHFGGRSWTRWEPDLARKNPHAVDAWAARHPETIRFHQWLQWQFALQWMALKAHANQLGVRIVGDAPIFIAHDSADCWGARDMFLLDDDGHPTVVAGVPPDYFSTTGQLWGNPLYRWDRMANDGYAWWARRCRSLMATVDLIRLDHFRGFAAHWEIPAGEPTAVKGRWVPGPAIALFRALEKRLGPLPIIAEDLGLITPDVEQLLADSGFPGMKTLQFGFDGDPRNIHCPHNLPPNSVVYTGTHDNDTTMGWWATAGAGERDLLARYAGSKDIEMPWTLIRLAHASPSAMAVIPAQDLLGLGQEARMNFPGRASGNWAWRLLPGALTEEIGQRLGEFTRLYGRA